MTNQVTPFTQCPTFAPADSEHYYKPAVFPEATIPNWVIEMCRTSGSIPSHWHMVTISPIVRCGAWDFNPKHDNMIRIVIPESCADHGVFWAVCDAVRAWYKEMRARVEGEEGAWVRHFYAAKNFIADVDHPKGVTFGSGTIGWDTNQIIKAKIAEAIA